MNWTKLLPIENYDFTTNLSIDEVYSRLSANIEPKQANLLSMLNEKRSKPYEGEISQNSFKINRIINYRNSFLPVIHGEMSNYFGQTRIKIRMRPAAFVFIFMAFWLGLVAIGCIVILFSGFINIKEVLHSGFSLMLLVPFGIFLFGCMLPAMAFKPESRKAKRFLATLLNEEEYIKPAAYDGLSPRNTYI